MLGSTYSAVHTGVWAAEEFLSMRDSPLACETRHELETIIPKSVYFCIAKSVSPSVVGDSTSPHSRRGFQVAVVTRLRRLELLARNQCWHPLC